MNKRELDPIERGFYHAYRKSFGQNWYNMFLELHAQYLVLDALEKGGESLTKETGLSRPTIFKTIEELENDLFISIRTVPLEIDDHLLKIGKRLHTVISSELTKEQLERKAEIRKSSQFLEFRNYLFKELGIEQ